MLARGAMWNPSIFATAHGRPMLPQASVVSRFVQLCEETECPLGNAKCAAAHHMPPTTCRPPHAAHHMPTTTCRPPHAAHRMPTTACRPPHADHRKAGVRRWSRHVCVTSAVCACVCVCIHWYQVHSDADARGCRQAAPFSDGSDCKDHGRPSRRRRCLRDVRALYAARWRLLAGCTRAAAGPPRRADIAHQPLAACAGFLVARRRCIST